MAGFLTSSQLSSHHPHPPENTAAFSCCLSPQVSLAQGIAGVGGQGAS